MTSSYSDQVFRRRLDQALTTVRTVLASTRNPSHPSDVHHEYTDKYSLVTFATKAAACSVLKALEHLGLDEAGIARLRAWRDSNRTVTLRFTATSTCKLDRKESREVESNTKLVTERSWVGKTTTKVVTTVTDFFWTVGAEWRIEAVAGKGGKGEAPAPLSLLARTRFWQLKTASESAPLPESHRSPASDCEIGWLVDLINAGDGSVEFGVDRTDAKRCRTPRRNPEIEAALSCLGDLGAWAGGTSRHFLNGQPYRRWWTAHSPALSPASIGDISCISPVLAMVAFEGTSPSPSTPAEVGLFGEGAAVPAAVEATAAAYRGPGDLPAVLAHYAAQLDQRKAELDATFAPDGDGAMGLITTREAWAAMVLGHIAVVANEHSGAVNLVEDMLRRQLVAAIGKEVGPKEFGEYMDFHSRALFKDDFAPRGLCHAVRRSDMSPEGTISVEDAASGAPVKMCVASAEASVPMRVQLSAATEVSFLGERHVHACVLHRFSGQSPAALELVATARQFSSFILMVGKIVSATQFEPTGAMVVKDKDDLRIPLLLETIPTPKEFKDAIVSLSPEQQDFCKAFRKMQLASTLFGVVVIQIKPQLERLLNLPSGALTKEIALTQDLMKLFVEYQIPSDLVSFDGRPEAESAARIGAVKAHVRALNEMIAKEKAKEIEEAAARAVKAQLLRASYLRDEEEAMSLKGSGFMEPSKESSRRSSLKMMKSGSPLKMKSRSRGRGGGGGGGGGVAILSEAISMRSGAMRKMGSAPPPRAKPMAISEGAPPPAPSTAAPPVAKPPQTQQEQEQPPQDGGRDGGASSDACVSAAEGDFTTLPGEMDRRLEQFDQDSALRPTIIKTGGQWRKRSQRGVLSARLESTLRETEQKDAKAEAFDLLDALTRSGVLPCDDAALHVVLAATHCFDRTLLDTVTRDNVNPIAKVERSTLILAALVHGQPAEALVREDRLGAVRDAFPQLLLAEGAEAE